LSARQDIPSLLEIARQHLFFQVSLRGETRHWGAVGIMILMMLLLMMIMMVMMMVTTIVMMMVVMMTVMLSCARAGPGDGDVLRRAGLACRPLRPRRQVTTS
jgi:hypothetical protein